MRILILAIFLFLSLVNSANADQTDTETIKAIEVARKDFQARTAAMYPPTGEYSALRQLGSYSMGIAETRTKIIVVFLVDKRLGFVGGGGEYTLSKKDAQVLSFQGYE